MRMPLQLTIFFNYCIHKCVKKIRMVWNAKIFFYRAFTPLKFFDILDTGKVHINGRHKDENTTACHSARLHPQADSQQISKPTKQCKRFSHNVQWQQIHKHISFSKQLTTKNSQSHRSVFHSQRQRTHSHINQSFAVDDTDSTSTAIRSSVLMTQFTNTWISRSQLRT